MIENIPGWYVTEISPLCKSFSKIQHGRPIEIAHRGYSEKYKDNSVEAFNESINNKFDMIELDIQLCKNDIIVNHDLTIDNKNIIDMTLEELRKYNLISLKEFFDIVKNKDILVYLDLKGSIELSQKLLDCLYELNIDLSKIFVSSFNLEHIKYIYENNKQINISFISSSMLDNNKIDEIMKYNLKFICFNYTILTQECIDYCHNKKTKVYVYTCSNETDYKEIKKFNQLDGIVTDYKIY